MTKESNAMVSRSLRLRKDTLASLKTQADKHGLGITVYIRTVLEKLVDNLPDEQVSYAEYGDTGLHYPEL